jgi:uncharacterized protein DUF1641
VCEHGHTAEEDSVTAQASLIAPLDDESLTATPNVDALKRRLDDPAVAESVSLILDHVDLVATLLTGLDGLVRRGDVISDSVASAVDEVRTASAGRPGAKLLPDIDLPRLQSTLGDLASAVVEIAPTLKALLHSGITDPATVRLLADAGDALVEGKAAADQNPRGPRGVFALVRVTKDPDVSRGLGLLIQVARAFGKKLAHEQPR